MVCIFSNFGLINRMLIKVLLLSWLAYCCENIAMQFLFIVGHFSTSQIILICRLALKFVWSMAIRQRIFKCIVQWFLWQDLLVREMRPASARSIYKGENVSHLLRAIVWALISTKPLLFNKCLGAGVLENNLF